MRTLLSLLTVFGAALVFQLLYGGLVYVVLKKLNLLKLPTALLGYLTPLVAYQLLGSDPPKDIFSAAPWFWRSRLPLLDGLLFGH